MTNLLVGLRGEPVLVVGLGRSGLAAARRLVAAGARVTATDAQPLEKLPNEARALAGAGATLRCGGHAVADFTGARLIVLSPGVPLDLPELRAAREKQVPVCSEIDLVAHLVEDRVIGITGSNGKSTTTALAAAMLGAAGHDDVPCGNFGLPLCDAVQGDRPDRWYAVELSSFQLDITGRLTASAAVLLNVQADHLDRHGDFHAYRAAKEKIAGLRRPGAPLVLAVDDPLVADFARRVGGPVLAVSADREVAAGGFVRAGQLTLRLGGHEETLADEAQLAIPGRHNRINALAAAVACRAVGVPLDAVRKALLAFRALAHRIQEVAQVEGVRYVDDSKATNVGSVLEAIRALRERTPEGRRLLVLLGGRDKGSDFRPLAPSLAAGGAVAITFGEAGPLIAAALAAEGVPPLAQVARLEDAVAAAHAAAVPGEAVLLSPACASFDAFQSYAHRGDVFAATARALAGSAGAGGRG